MGEFYYQPEHSTWAGCILGRDWSCHEPCLRKKSGDRLVPSLCLIDSGYDADSTYDFCANNADRALPVKGSSNPMMSHFKLSKINKSDSKAFGMNLVLVDGDKYKDMIAGRMKKENGRGA